MEILGPEIKAYRSAKGVIAILKSIKDRYDACQGNIPAATALEDTYQRLVERLQSMSGKYRETFFRFSNYEATDLTERFEELNTTFSATAKQLTTELTKLQKRQRFRITRIKLTEELLSALQQDANQARQKLDEIEIWLDIASLVPHMALPDRFRPCNTAPPNGPDIILNFESLDEIGIPLSSAGRLKAATLASSNGQSVGALSAGMGGVGKSCALRALAYDPDILERFPGGVLFMPLGKDATVETLTECLSSAVEATGGKQLANELRRETKFKTVLQKMGNWFDDILKRLSKIARNRGEEAGSRLVYSTRDTNLKVLGTLFAFKPWEVQGTLSATVLLRCAEANVNELHDPICEKAIEKILNMCAGLPVALNVAGRGVRWIRQKWRGDRRECWVAYSAKMEDGILDEEAGVSGNLGHSLMVSLDYLDEQRDTITSGDIPYSFRVMHRSLCVFEKQVAISAATLQRFWDLDEVDTHRIISAMHRVGVIDEIRVLEDGRETVSVRLHDLIHDFAMNEADKHGEKEMWNKKLYKILETADPKIVEAALREGRTKLDTVRLMVLGGPTRGKTTTLASLCGEPFQENRESTNGVDPCISHLIPGNREGSENRAIDVPQSDTFQAKFQTFARSKKGKPEATASGSSTYLRKQPESAPTTQAAETEADKISGVAAAEEAPETTSDDVMRMAESSLRSDNRFTGSSEGVKLRCWDFGGQREYEVAHELFISPHSICMLVFDLKRFEDLESRKSEVEELIHWLQTIFALTAEEDVSSMAESVLIVATRRDECAYREKIGEYLWEVQDMLIRGVDAKVAQALNISGIQIIALENRTAIREPEESGLLELERHLRKTARKIIAASQDVPLRWLAFLESLKSEGEGSYSLCGQDILSRTQGFFFPQSPFRREDELKALLLYFRDLGELVLLGTARGNIRDDALKCFVFLHPEKILAALKTVIAPMRVRCKGLDVGRHRDMISKGLISTEMLMRKWKSVSSLSREEDRMALIALLTSLDLLLDLGDGLFGIPALLESGWEDWGWMSCSPEKKEISVVTVFDNYVPFGLVGTLIARIHRIVGQGQKDIRYVRSNAVLLTLRMTGREGICQVFVGFDKDKREIHWKIRGSRYDFSMLGRCLQVFEEYKAERFNSVVCSHRHLLISVCPEGCGQKGFRMEFEVPSLSTMLHDQRWWEAKGMTVAKISDMCTEEVCENSDCLNHFSYAQTMGASEPSTAPGVTDGGQVSSGTKQYVVFISHAGADKDKDMAEYMQRRFEKDYGLRTFVDRQELTGSHEYADVLIRKALESASVFLFILSPEFFARKWTMIELQRALSRRENGESVVLFPIFHRLSYDEASSDKLHEMEKFQEVFVREKLFDKIRAKDCDVKNMIKTMRQLCRCTGLVKTLKDLHDESKWRNGKRYDEVKKERVELEGREWDGDMDARDRFAGLEGVMLEEFFDFAVKRVLKAYHDMPK